ncbi:hypothetical protein FUAX_54180 (plasmid) [Fulvitalea axinellae]|uniref:Uncharacterized protein n=1 Tax=Fulvitalea axinellae TaxID=1182444 RepID=A0AAU9DIL5_9BACT|nr:hypothetical protein FUAX_54180 [Fulvitalea axinellae]
MESLDRDFLYRDEPLRLKISVPRPPYSKVEFITKLEPIDSIWDSFDVDPAYYYRRIRYVHELGFIGKASLKTRIIITDSLTGEGKFYQHTYSFDVKDRPNSTQ